MALQLLDTPANWPVGGGIAGDLVRRLDWSRTSLGPIAGWRQNLRIKVNSIVNSPIPQVLMWGPDHVMIYNDSYIEIAGSYHPAAMGGTVREIWPEIWDWNRRILAEGFAGRVQAFREQSLTVWRHGRPEEVVFDLFYTPIYSDDGLAVEGVLCTVLDLTQAVAARTALAESRAELQSLTDALPIVVGFLDTDLVYRMANPRYVEVFGLTPGQIIGRPAREVVGPAHFAAREPDLRRALRGEEVIIDAPVMLPGGQSRMFEIRYTPRRGPGGAVAGIYVLMIDIEERKATEARLRDSNERFAAAVAAIHGVLWTNGPDGLMPPGQAGWQALTGQTEAEYVGHGWLDAVHPEDRAGSLASWQAAVAAKSTYTWEHRVRRRDGSWGCFAIRAVPTVDAQGAIREWVGVHTDITDQRAAEAELVERARDLERQVRHRQRAEEQLRQLNEGLEARVEAEVAERRKAERALQQAQKMEAIGQLTGGIAHDFNNLSQVVAGNLELLARDVADDPRAARRVANALAAVHRGARLSAQLLAFARRQALEPRVIQPARLIAGMDDLLRRSLGDAIGIELILPEGLWNTCVDPGQVENVILNLAINARDAMEGSGRLTIEAANVELDAGYARRHAEVRAGEYVMLAVTDTGSGMPPEVLEKVFEPFFSTKPEGRGTGLGLSMVYGFVKQSGGHVAIYSEPGQGTTVRVYLPRATAEAAPAPLPPAEAPLGGTETILVVEDDEGVRRTAVDLLEDLGYRVLTAPDPQAGLALIEGGAAIDAIFTDVVMPGPLTSRDMARRAQELLPGVGVLFTSGYTENSIVHGGRLDPGVELLSKPYSHEALARRLRHVLANRRQAGAVTAGPAPAAEGGAAVQPAAPPGDSAADPAIAAPAGVAPPDAADPAPRPGPAGTRVPETPLEILLVEDNFLIRADTAMMLEELGHRVVQAANAAQGLRALGEGRFDLLLSDLGLPDQPGDLLLSDLGLPDQPGDLLAARALAIQPGLAVIFATGEGRLPDGSPPRAVLLAKPYTEAHLARAITRALAARPAAG